MRKTVRRATIVLALTPLVSVPSTVAFAAGQGHGGSTTTITTPAPSGDASAVAAEVNGVIAAGKTKAHAGSDGGSATADSLDVLGQRVAGGDQKGVGAKDGNLLATGDTPLGDAEVAPWSAKVTDTGGGTQSHAEAALAHAALAGLVEIWILHSTSDATWTPDRSTGDSQSDGAEVSALGMLDVKVLHSEAHSTGKGRSDLLVVNGTEIGSSDQVNGACSISADPLLNLICLTASGGTDKTGVTSATGTVAGFVAGGGAVTGTVSSSTSRGAAGTPGTPAKQPHSGGTTSGARPPAAKPPAAPAPVVNSPSAALPFTGDETGRLAAIAIALASLGGTMTMFGRRRRLAPIG